MEKEMYQRSFFYPKNNLSKEKGITLIALVITIIVLLILAGVSISMLSGENSILTRAKEAKQKTEEAGVIESIKLAYMNTLMGNSPSDNEEFANAMKEELKKTYPEGNVSVIGETDGVYYVKVNNYNYDIDKNGNVKMLVSKLPKGLKVGSSVTYIPSGSYTWQAMYATSDLTENVEISSENSDFKITNWKVLSYNEVTDEILLIPDTLSTGKVKLQGAQGYNNAVKLLNDACDALYSTTKNGTKIAKARSINLNDVEKCYSEEGINARNTYLEVKSGLLYNTSFTNNAISPTLMDENGSYTVAKVYPSIYAQEKNSIINNVATNGTLKPSEQTTFIERANEKVTNANSIHPTNTYYNFTKDNTSFAFEDEEYKSYFKKYGENNEHNYLELLAPLQGYTKYWIATRCIRLREWLCRYEVCYFESGRTSATELYYSNDFYNEPEDIKAPKERSLFPVVSVRSEHINKKGNDQFEVK